MPKGSFFSFLGVPSGYDVIGVFGIGYPAGVPSAKTRTPIASKITYLAKSFPDSGNIMVE